MEVLSKLKCSSQTTISPKRFDSILNKAIEEEFDEYIKDLKSYYDLKTNVPFCQSQNTSKSGRRH